MKISIYLALIIFILNVQGFAHETGHDPYFHLTDPAVTIPFTPDEIDYIKNKKRVVLCTDPDWMPYEKFDHDGTYIGVAADYHKILSHLTGLKYEIYHSKSWPETLELAQSGKCDLLSILNSTPERVQYLDFSQPIINSPSVFVTRERDKFINGIGDLSGKTLAIVHGYMVDEIVRTQYPEINRVYADNISEALKLVSKGKAFATVGSLLEMSYNIRQLGLLNLKITGDAKFGFDLAVGVKKDEPHLLSVINKSLSSIKKPEKDKILNKWISIKYEKSYDYDFIAKLLVAVAFVFAVIIGKTLLTAKYNRQLLNLNSELAKAKRSLEDVNRELEIKVMSETAKRLENERLLMQQSKLAAMGDMIGAIAHQWRQPLNAAALLVQDIEDAYESDSLTEEILHDNVNKTMQMILQMSETIDDFSNFLKPDKSKSSFKLCKTISEVANMFGPQLKNHNIALRLECMDRKLNEEINSDEFPFECCSTISVVGYPNEFKHVMMNIIKNSMDALDELSGSGKYINISISSDMQEYSSVTISDNGGGIPQKIASRIFEPYFSTKKEKNGVGIGLYMSRQIINNMDGDLSFENREDGASFTIKVRLAKTDSDEQQTKEKPLQ